MNRTKFLSAALFFGMTLIPAFVPSVALAQRPSAPRLFSQKALIYARVDDTRELKDKLASTATGRLANDPKLSPILKTFYSSFTSSIQGMQEAIGINFDELLSIPNGELAFALLPTKGNPCFCVMIEAGDEIPAVELMIGRLQEQMVSRGGEKTTKEVGKITVTQLRNGTREDRQVGYFIDSGVLVACSNADYAETLALIWTGNGIDHKSLADNRDFTTIMSRCVGTEGERPQASFFVDPIAMVREIGKSNNGSLVVLAGIKALGLNGIKAIGGSVILAPADFDSIVHGHLLIDPNRQGVMRAIRPKSGSTDPEPWVNDQVISYSTLNWDFGKTVKAVGEIVDTFQGENAFETNVIANANKALGIDLRKDFIDILDDRLSITQLIVPPKRVNSQSNIYSLHMKEANRFKTEVLPKFFAKIKDQDGRWESKLIGDSTVYTLNIAQNNESRAIRVPQPSFGMLGDELIISDSIKGIEEAIKTYSSGEDLLVDALEFKLVRDRIKAQLKNAETSVMAYQRPEESLRLFYDLAVNPDNITSLESMAENNPFFTALVTALRSKQLPPFEEIAKYLAPSGAFLVEEENGLHYTAFSLKRE